MVLQYDSLNLSETPTGQYITYNKKKWGCLKTRVIKKWEEKCPDRGKMPGDLFPKTIDFFPFFFNLMSHDNLKCEKKTQDYTPKIFLFQTGWMGRSAG
jgi:hypothetical protein